MDEIAWEMKVPILKNSIIVKQLLLAIGIPFGAVIVLFIIIKAYNGLFLIGLMFVLALLVALLVFRGTYDVQYVINESGIVCRTQAAQKKRVRKMSAAVFFLGLFKGNLTAANIGLLAAASTDVKINWKRVKKIKFIDTKKKLWLPPVSVNAPPCFATRIPTERQNNTFKTTGLTVKKNKDERIKDRPPRAGTAWFLSFLLFAPGAAGQNREYARQQLEPPVAFFRPDGDMRFALRADGDAAPHALGEAVNPVHVQIFNIQH